MPVLRLRSVEAEELRLREDCLLVLVDEDALVRRVDVREPVGGPEQQHLGRGDSLLEGVYERDRSAGRDHHRLRTPGAPQSLAGRVVCRARGVSGEAASYRVGLHRQIDAEWAEALEVPDQ